MIQVEFRDAHKLNEAARCCQQPKINTQWANVQTGHRWRRILSARAQQKSLCCFPSRPIRMHLMSSWAKNYFLFPLLQSVATGCDEYILILTLGKPQRRMRRSRRLRDTSKGMVAAWLQTDLVTETRGGGILPNLDIPRYRSGA